MVFNPTGLILGGIFFVIVFILGYVKVILPKKKNKKNNDNDRNK